MMDKGMSGRFQREGKRAWTPLLIPGISLDEEQWNELFLAVLGMLQEFHPREPAELLKNPKGANQPPVPAFFL